MKTSENVLLRRESGPTVLVVVGSAGREPWTEVESRGQQPFTHERSHDSVHALWVQPEVRLDSLFHVEVLNRWMSKRFEKFSLKPQAMRVRDLFDLSLGLMVRAFAEVFFFAYCSRKPIVEGNRITVRFPGNYFLNTMRQLSIFKYVLGNYEFDYLLRTTSTCLFEPTKLFKFASGLPTNGVYAGEVYQKGGVEFVSGAGILFSRDVVELLAKRASQVRFDVHDDVAIGAFMQQSTNIVPAKVSRWDFLEDHDFRHLDQNTLDPKFFLFRCKANSGETTRAEPVLEVMNRVGSAFRSMKD